MADTTTFSVADYIVFALVLLFLAAIGLFYGCRGGGQKTTKDFLMGGISMALGITAKEGLQQNQHKKKSSPGTTGKHVVTNMEDKAPAWFTEFKENLTKRMDTLNAGLNEVDKKAYENKSMIHEMQNELQSLKQRVVYSEAQSRRNNLIFDCIAEKNTKETWAGFQNRLCELLEKQTDLNKLPTLRPENISTNTTGTPAKAGYSPTSSKQTLSIQDGACSTDYAGTPAKAGYSPTSSKQTLSIQDGACSTDYAAKFLPKSEKEIPSMEDIISNISNIKLIKNRIDQIRLKMPDIQRASDELYLFMEGIIEHINEQDPVFKWVNLNVGSYYEKLKITRPDEFDINIEATLREGSDASKQFNPQLRLDSTNTPPGFCSIRAAKTPYLRHLITEYGGHHYLCMKKFKDRFYNFVINAFSELKEDWQFEIEKPELTCPAVTVNFFGEMGPISVDLVPSIMIPWPEELRRHWKPIWPKQIVYHDINRVHVVAKSHPSEIKMPSQKTLLWRISFSEIEKSLITHADGTANREGSKKTYRKYFVKLLKSFLEIEIGNALKKAGIDEKQKTICSYHMKTLALNMFNTTEYKNVSHWLYKRLGYNLRQALIKLRQHVDRKVLPHHFIPDYNLFEFLSPVEQEMIKQQIDLALSDSEE